MNEPELWSVTEIANWMKVSRATVMRKVVTLPRFPAPLPGAVRKRRWVKADVVEFMAERRAA